jgi:hypothetical protein
VPGRNALCLTLLAVTVLLLWSDCALAYVGPGAGLELTGYFFSLVAWGATAFSMVLLWPFYALLRRIRGIKDPLPGGTEAVATVHSPEVPIDGSHSSA